MKFSKAAHRIITLLCIATVCLLSLASVSPQIHNWVFHGGHVDSTTCPDVHSVCTDQPGEDSEPDTSEKGDACCPVMLFEQGVTIADSSSIQLPQSFPATERIAIVPETVSTRRSEGAAQARAPPIS